MADTTKYGNAVEFDVDLHSIYAAYIGLFESTNTDWWEKSWGGYFVSFNDFLGFGWEVMVVVDSETGKPHVAVRREQIALFARMIRTRFGESLSKDPPTTLPLNPVPTRNLALRRLVTVRDLSAYRKLAASLPAAELSYLRSRVRSGEATVIEQLFYAGGSSGERETGGVGVRDNGVGYTFACVKTNWWEKGGPPYGLIPGQGRTHPGNTGQGSNKGLVLEIGLAVLRCANLRALGVWPPVPADNYRKSHYVVEEWVDKRANHNPPTFPRAYAFGQSEFVAEKRVETILDATLNALASQENDGHANALILLTVGEPVPLPLPSSSTLPNNILQFDVLALEYNFLRRAQAQGIPGTPDRQQPLTSLASLLQTLQIPIQPFAPLGNAGNDAYYTLLAFQKLVMGETRLPDILFSQPGPYGSMPFPLSHRSSVTLPFPQYPAVTLPVPVMPAAVSDSRRSSTSSNRPGSGFVQPSLPPSSFDRTQGGRYASETSTRRRPISIGDPLNIYTDSSNRTSSDLRTPNGLAQDANLGVGSQRGKRMPVVRSQTVFWDDAAYADSNSARSAELKTPLPNGLTGDSTLHVQEQRTRPREGPPLSRSAGKSTWLGSQGRSISYDVAGSTGGISGTSSAANSPIDKPLGSLSNINIAHTGMKPSGLSSTSLHRDTNEGAYSSGTGSSGNTKPSPGSSGEVQGMGHRLRYSTGSIQAVDDVKNGAKNGKEKKKGKGPKDLAGAIAKFWIG
ncbi:hypothetical protein C343_02533 [Cryptococcus neoformans C23]|uniref:Gfd2/YDR514C-like C-terminal domain-containing protein n=1 Tax=Cryptococcus neoformans (strain H99 / ATCC 208821 / CBS 10515 / FGSC 9487) TaxID=235443 RepID=J9VJ41_CRYN9|nr:hypothetical protein CNAG_05187 [Cryptococcus neoformans var. grubii H99]AUB24112.1 hypothetical protein CKF44_05187 [Cryptococcus neoformans var. grubii]OWZ33571.1 hypothetical protein C347_02601 [Cryptococcus neoformans var. grubii AD2-60a]OWZ45667.1 hypothetical protein C343_02533 [Cryptococcus neoformans var. grubii C23]OXC85467.1 hypothetical protein C344_02299 [Cryptococcus neoformans var. grubii AD1-7a]OXG36369.1 hypothetical protein C360_02985 [Cryptococcus neoformans var. grubii Bt|eukprot:XP_012048769.1 hypothetical protein CNAG_05187 [Cryptococcus neoformans var. grubii H99]